MIRAVKRQLKGPVQKNMQIMNDAVEPLARQPLCLDLTDFTCRHVSLNPPPAASTTTNGCRVWQYNSLGSLTDVTYFTKASLIGNPFYASMNQDIPDGGVYTPIRVTYHIKVSGKPSLDNTHVQFDVFSAKTKAYVPGSINNDTVMPVALKHMQSLTGGTQNIVNSDYFKKYWTKRIFFNSTKHDDDTKGTTGNIKYFSFTINPKKDRNQRLTNPIDPMDQRPEVPAGNYGYLNCPVDEPLWMVISTTDITSLPAPDPDVPVVEISRTCVWRDKVGKGSL